MDEEEEEEEEEEDSLSFDERVARALAAADYASEISTRRTATAGGFYGSSCILHSRSRTHIFHFHFYFLKLLLLRPSIEEFSSKFSSKFSSIFQASHHTND